MTVPGQIHFVAIGGTGMGSLAGLMKARGASVTGSDQAVYPPMSEALADWGIPVQEGFQAANVLERAPCPPDCVVIGNAVRPDNPEARAVMDTGLPYRSFPDALYEWGVKGRHSVVIAGTHGKTTTTSLVAFLLDATGRDPSVLVGGISQDLGGSFRDGSGEHFVIEGDEYDTAFFDKTPKFLHYHPQTLVLTSIEFDHADIYRDLEHVKEAFLELISGMPKDGVVVACISDENVSEVIQDAPCRVITYSVDSDLSANWRASRLLSDTDGTVFQLENDSQSCSVRLPMHGAINVANALGALAAVESLGVPLLDAVSAIAGFRGVRRRQELRGEVRNVAVIDDFAHHPTAVRGSVEAIRARYPGRRLLVILEPRSNTSRRRVFQKAYVDALAGADQVLVQRVPDGPIYSATGEVGERFSADELAEDLRLRGVAALSLDGVEAIVEELAREAKPGDVVVTMSNGAFGNIWEKLLRALGQ